MHSLALSVIFGLSLSFLVALIFIPVLYASMYQRKEKRQAKKVARRQKRAIKRAEKEQNVNI